jgi:hypothetical protein
MYIIQTLGGYVSLESMPSRHMYHVIIIKALIEVLTEEQLDKVVNIVQ